MCHLSNVENARRLSLTRTSYTLDVVLHPFNIFNDKIKQYCLAALEEFDERDARCGYVQPHTGLRCVNTQAGHAKGHQSEDGEQLEQGDYWSNLKDICPLFLEAIKQHIRDFIRSLQEKSEEERPQRSFAIKCHRETLHNRSNELYWTTIFSPNSCFVCLCCSPQYILPCGHALCEDCVRDFDQGASNQMRSTIMTHPSCILCGARASENGWPWKIRLKPKSAGVRLLSLDGGGVRGIIELEILRRLEQEIGLDLPISNFFDLIVGTSAGTSYSTQRPTLTE